MFCGPSTVDVSDIDSRVHKTYCFPRSQSISVNCYMLKNKQSDKENIFMMSQVVLFAILHVK